MKRDWKAFRAKVDAEGRCRLCGTGGRLEAAHLIPRSRIPIHSGCGEDPRNAIPLCPPCHRSYDIADHRTGHRQGVIHVTTKQEQAYCVELVGIEEAYARLLGRRLSSVAESDTARGPF
ncbi:MAG: HNH endonuclease [Betaproteobacteria bacterium]|nr:HNH endonuclease [Betaproteobacteria bacterium]